MPNKTAQVASMPRTYPKSRDLLNVSVAPLGERYTQGWLAMLRPLDEHSRVDHAVMATLAQWLERCQLTADARATAWSYLTAAECQEHMDYLAHEFPGMDSIPPEAADLYDCRVMYLALKARRDELANRATDAALQAYIAKDGFLAEPGGPYEQRNVVASVPPVKGSGAVDHVPPALNKARGRAKAHFYAGKVVKPA